MITIEMTQQHLDLLRMLLNVRIKEIEASLGRGILDDDSGVIGEATARIRVWEEVRKSLEVDEQSKQFLYPINTHKGSDK